MSNAENIDKAAITCDPSKWVEFNAFLDYLESMGNPDPVFMGSWSAIARALGVNKNTITRWKAHPKAVALKTRAISANFKQMREGGVMDWKMGQNMLKYLDMDTVDKSEVTINVEAEKKEEGNTLMSALKSIGKKK